MVRYKMYIGNEWTDSAAGKWFPVINPATNERIAEVALGEAQDMDRAIEEANRAQDKWGKMSPFMRGNLLRKASGLVVAHAEEIAMAMSLEQGKPLKEASQEVKKGAEILRYYAEEGERIYGRIIANEVANCESQVIYQPIGVCGAISPWNYPVELLAWKIGGALAAGCCLICKLPYETPISGLLFIRAIVEAGIPRGVLNAIPGRGSVLGPVMMKDQRVKNVAFTGSTRVGKDLLSQAGDTLKKLSLELGGSLPAIICEDCDLEKAVTGTVRRSFRNLGQICIAINRVYVHRNIYGEYISRLAEETNRLTIGNGSCEEVDLGAMCTKAGLKKVKEHVADAVAKGARLLCGGAAPEGEKYSAGNFYQPTVLADVTHEMLIMREETFGPVVGVMPYDTLDEAIALANDTGYGLAAICYTNNLYTARRVSQEVQAGNIAINNVDAGVINAPYGGWKESGFGCEHGPEGLHEYLRIKHVRTCY